MPRTGQPMECILDGRIGDVSLVVDFSGEDNLSSFCCFCNLREVKVLGVVEWNGIKLVRGCFSMCKVLNEDVETCEQEQDPVGEPIGVSSSMRHWDGDLHEDSNQSSHAAHGGLAPDVVVHEVVDEQGEADGRSESEEEENEGGQAEGDV